MKRTAVLIISLLVIAASIAPSVAEVRYSVTDLGTLGGIYSSAFGVNDNGDVVGDSYPGYVNGHRAFIWEDGSMVALGSIDGNYYDYNTGYGINDKRQVVGETSYRNSSLGGNRAFLWDNGVMRNLGTLGGNWSAANDINNDSQIVGYAVTTQGRQHAFLWQNNVMTDLGTLGGYDSRATAINENGQVVGWSRTSVDDGKNRAFIWQNGTMTRLGTVSDVQSEPTDINDLGQVVGSYYPIVDGDTELHAFLWQNGVTIDLGGLGGSKGWANGVNNLGQVVGIAETSNSFAPFLWEDGVMTPLQSLISPDSGLQIKEPYAINNSGQIVGVGFYGPHTHAFLLTPVPEPSSFMTLICGLGGIYGFIRRKRA